MILNPTLFQITAVKGNGTCYLSFGMLGGHLTLQKLFQNFYSSLIYKIQCYLYKSYISTGFVTVLTKKGVEISLFWK